MGAGRVPATRCLAHARPSQTLLRRMARAAARAGAGRGAHRVRAAAPPRERGRQRARPTGRAGARGRRERFAAARRHQQGAAEHPRGVRPERRRASRQQLGASEDALGRDPRRAQPLHARCSRDRAELERAAARRTPLRRSRLLRDPESRAQHRGALCLAAAALAVRSLRDRRRTRAARSDGPFRRRGRRRSRGGVLRGRAALGAVRARHVGGARARRRQGVPHRATGCAGARPGRAGRSARCRAAPPAVGHRARRSGRRQRGPAGRGARGLATGLADGQAARHRPQPVAGQRLPAVAQAGDRDGRIPCRAVRDRLARRLSQPVAAARVRPLRGRRSRRAPAQFGAARRWACGTGTSRKTGSVTS